MRIIQLSKLWSELHRVAQGAPVRGPVAKGTLTLTGFNGVPKKTYVHPRRLRPDESFAHFNVSAAASDDGKPRSGWGKVLSVSAREAGGPLRVVLETKTGSVSVYATDIDKAILQPDL